MLASIQHSDLNYYEGFYVTEIGLPLEHGFNVNSEGVVVDVTAHRHNIKVSEYFGIRHDLETIFEHASAETYMELNRWYYLTKILNQKI